VSAASAFFSGLQWFETHNARNRPAPVQIIESPRLSFESAGAVKLLQGGAEIKVEFPSGKPERLPYNPHLYLTATLTFKNTGRTGATIIGCTYSSHLSYAYTTADPTSAKFLGLPYPRSSRDNGEYQCDPISNRGTSRRALTVSPGESAQILVASMPVTKAEVADLKMGRLGLSLGGTISYEDSFHRMLKTYWMGVIHPGAGFFMAQVGHLP
jgi:hypothetical protein